MCVRGRAATLRQTEKLPGNERLPCQIMSLFFIYPPGVQVEPPIRDLWDAEDSEAIVSQYEVTHSSCLGSV